MEIWNSKASQICISIANLAFTAEIHKRRTATLANRVKIIVETIATVVMTSVAGSLRVKGSLSLLDVSLGEIEDYFHILQQKDNALGRRVKRFGSDEETFSKWNETLKSCCEDLSLTSLGYLFDANKDLEDFNGDMESLNADLRNIMEKVVDAFGLPEQAIEAIQKLLQQQHTQRTLYKTQQAVKADKIFDVKAIRWEKEIGRGGFGVVWKARYKGDYVAIKKLPSASLSTKMIASLKLEAEFMKRVAHPRIVACLGVLEYDDNYCMVMELCVNGSLDNYLTEHESVDVDWEQRTDFAVDIATGMNYLHKLGVIHRDLKLGNVVLDENDRGKITDFGLSVVKTASQTSMQLDESGTPQYMAPESFGLVPTFSTKSDVYAFSIILWELSHWELAYRGVSPVEIKDSIKNGARLPIDPSVPQNLNKLTARCWKQNPKHRPDFSAIIAALTENTTKTESLVPKIFSYSKSKDERYTKVKTASSKAPLVPNPTFVSKYRSRKFYFIAFAILFLVLISTGVGIFFALNSNRSVSGNEVVTQVTITTSQNPTIPTLLITSSSSTTATSSSESTVLSDVADTNKENDFSNTLPLSKGSSSGSWESTEISSGGFILASLTTPGNEVSTILSYGGASASTSTASSMQQDLTTVGNEVSATLSYDGATARIASASSTQLDLSTAGYEVSTTINDGASASTSTASASSTQQDLTTTGIEVSTTIIDGTSASPASASSMQQDATTAGDEFSATLSYDGATASIASASSMEQDLTTTGIEMLASTTLGSDTIITSGDSITTATEIQTSPDSLPSSSEIISELPTTTTEPLAPDTSIATSSLSTTTTAGPNYTTIPVVSTFVSTGFTRFIRSMTFRKSDNMTFVTEVNGGFLYAITSLGAVSTLITGAANPINGPLNTARVVYPYGITVNINDDLVVSDRTHNIRAINQTDMYSLAGDLSKNPSISVNNPTGVAVDNSGNVYWTQDNGMIKKCDTNGIVTSFSGYSGSGYADGPASEAKFTLPKGIIFDSNNDVFYISSNHYISKMNMSGHVTMLAGNEVSGSTNAVGLAARFYTPAGLALDGRGNLIIADSLNNLVRSMDLATLNVTTIGGSVGIKNSRDGFGNQSLFAIPRDVALNQNGEILVLDYDNYAIRKITYTTFQI